MSSHSDAKERAEKHAELMARKEAKRQDKQNADRIREEKKNQAKKEADAYLANHPNKGKGGIKDAQYDKILKKGGLTNHSYQEIKKVENKQKWEEKKAFQKESMLARRDARKEMRDATGYSTYDYGSARDKFIKNYNSNDEESYLVAGDKFDPDKDYSLDPNEKLAKDLIDSGKDFSWRDYHMHKNDGARNSRFNYEPYGGYENWYQNHSLYGSNGWTGSQNVMSQDEIAAAETKRTQDRRNYITSDEYMKRYGKYDWAQNEYNYEINNPNRGVGVTQNSSNHIVDMKNQSIKKTVT